MKEINLIGLHGKLQSGKDITTKITQYLTSKYDQDNNEPFRLEDIYSNSEWKNKKFAGKLKQIVSLLIGCNISDLENEEFKNRPLGEEWDRVKCNYRFEGKGFSSLFDSIEQAEKSLEEDGCYGYEFSTQKITPRLLLQRIGTNCLRDLIHPNIHVNSLFSDYKPTDWLSEDFAFNSKTEILINTPYREYSDGYVNRKMYMKYPKWIISDCRFLNEIEAIKSRGGIVIKITNPRIISTDLHESENALSEYNDFDYSLINDGSIDDLVVKVKQMLQHFEIIK